MINTAVSIKAAETQTKHKWNWILKKPEEFKLDKGVPPAQVAQATRPKLDSDIISTMAHTRAAEVSTGNEGWDPTKVKPVAVEWQNASGLY